MARLEPGGWIQFVIPSGDERLGISRFADSLAQPSFVWVSRGPAVRAGDGALPTEARGAQLEGPSD